MYIYMHIKHEPADADSSQTAGRRWRLRIVARALRCARWPLHNIAITNSVRAYSTRRARERKGRILRRSRVLLSNMNIIDY